MTYIKKTKFIKKSDIKNKEYSFSISSYNFVKILNKNYKYLGDRDVLKINNKGFEPGSSEYIDFGNNYFVRISELDNLNYLFSIGKDTKRIRPVNNKNFIQKGDLCYQTASNVGNICFYDGPKAYYNSHIRKLDFTKNKYYIFGILKSNFGREQVDVAGSIKGVDNFREEYLLNTKIPFPTEKNNKNPENIEKILSLIVQNIINKEEQIKEKNKLIDELIEKELKENQKGGEMEYSFPKINEIKEVGRLDTGLYEREFKYWNNLIKNYKKSKIYNLENDLKFTISRGQNLQVSNIGNSYYSDFYKKGFYKLLISKNFTDFGGIKGFSFIGNKNKLKKIQQGDIIFSCRGDLGRLIIFNEEIENTITNIDNIHIQNKNIGAIENTFIGLWLKFLRNIGYINKIAITGSGADSFTQYQFGELPILLFSEEKQKEIAELYYNKVEKNNDLNLENYLEKEKLRNKKLGIFQLNMELFKLREKLENIVKKIVMGEKIEIDFEY